MDPDICYHEMFTAMRDGDYETAREHAIDLREWLNRGGFIPTNHTQMEVLAYVANVLRRTAPVASR